MKGEKKKTRCLQRAEMQLLHAENKHKNAQWRYTVDKSHELSLPLYALCCLSLERFDSTEQNPSENLSKKNQEGHQEEISRSMKRSISAGLRMRCSIMNGFQEKTAPTILTNAYYNTELRVLCVSMNGSALKIKTAAAATTPAPALLMTTSP